MTRLTVKRGADWQEGDAVRIVAILLMVLYLIAAWDEISAQFYILPEGSSVETSTRD